MATTRCKGYTKEGKRCKRMCSGNRMYCSPAHRRSKHSAVVINKRISKRKRKSKRRKSSRNKAKALLNVIRNKRADPLKRAKATYGIQKFGMTNDVVAALTDNLYDRNVWVEEAASTVLDNMGFDVDAYMGET